MVFDLVVIPAVALESRRDRLADRVERRLPSRGRSGTSRGPVGDEGEGLRRHQHLDRDDLLDIGDDGAGLAGAPGRVRDMVLGIALAGTLSTEAGVARPRFSITRADIEHCTVA